MKAPISFKTLTKTEEEATKVIEKVIQDLNIDWKEVRPGETLVDEPNFRASNKKWSVGVYTHHCGVVGVFLSWRISGKVPVLGRVGVYLTLNSHQGVTLWEDHEEIWKGALEYNDLLRYGIVGNQALER